LPEFVRNTLDDLMAWKVHEVVLFQFLPVSGYGQQEIIGRDKKRGSHFLFRPDTQQESDEFLLELRGMRTDQGIDVPGIKTDFLRRIEAYHFNAASSETSTYRQTGFEHSENNSNIGTFPRLHFDFIIV